MESISEVRYPLHMKIKGLGDIAVLKNKYTPGPLHIQDFNSTFPFEDYHSVTIGRFSGGGTLFFVAKAQDTILVEGIRVTGLALTAAHCIFELPFGVLESIHNFCVDSKMHFQFIPLKNFLEGTKSMISSEGVKNVLGQDLVLGLVTSTQKELSFPIKELELIDDETCINQELCSVYGFPEKPENMFYSSPAIRELEESPETAIEVLFNGFKGPVKSEGLVLNEGDEIHLLEINCSATNGMSGSPVLVNQKLAGVYVGGPPVRGQNALYKLYKGLLEENYLYVLDKLNRKRDSLVFDASEEIQEQAQELLLMTEVLCKYCLKIQKEASLEVIKKFSKRFKNERTLIYRFKIQVTNDLYLLIFDLISEHPNPRSLCFNSAIPVKHNPSFKTVKAALKKFRSLEETQFSTIQEFKSYLLD